MINVALFDYWFKLFTAKLEESFEETAPETAPESTRERIVLLLQANPRLTKQDLMNNLQKASGTIKEHIRILKQEGRIKRIGPDKGGLLVLFPVILFSAVLIVFKRGCLVIFTQLRPGIDGKAFYMI